MLNSNLCDFTAEVETTSRGQALISLGPIFKLRQGTLSAKLESNLQKASHVDLNLKLPWKRKPDKQGGKCTLHVKKA